MSPIPRVDIGYLPVSATPATPEACFLHSPERPRLHLLSETVPRAAGAGGAKAAGWFLWSSYRCHSTNRARTSKAEPLKSFGFYADYDSMPTDAPPRKSPPDQSTLASRVVALLVAHVPSRYAALSRLALDAQ
jgi:hypothetical protein